MILNDLYLAASEFYKTCGQKLDKRHLESFGEDYESKLKYLKDLGLTEIGFGQGSSRVTYVLNSRKALKVQYNDFSNQNETEYETLSELNSQILPKVYDKADDYSWIEVELVRPLKSIEEFEQLSGINYADYYLITSRARNLNTLFEYIEFKISQFEKNDPLAIFYLLGGEYNEKDYENVKNRWVRYRDNFFLKELNKLLQETTLRVNEFYNIENLGKNSDGQLVLLDLGS